MEYMYRLIKVIRKEDNNNSKTELCRFVWDLTIEDNELSVKKHDRIIITEGNEFWVDQIAHQIVPRMTICYEYVDIHYRKLWVNRSENGIKTAEHKESDYLTKFKQSLQKKGWKQVWRQT